MNKIVFGILVVMLLSCQAKEKSNSTYHDFKDPNGEIVGNLNVVKLNDDVFIELIITNTSGEELYRFSREGLFEKGNLDLKISSDDFYGYKIESLTDDYIDIYLLTNNGQNISDPVTVQYDFAGKYFKRLVMP